MKRCSCGFLPLPDATHCPKCSKPVGNAALVRVFDVDFNNPRDELLARVSYWRPMPEVGEKVLLVDCDWDATWGVVRKIVKQADPEARTSGYIECASDYSMWLDGEAVLSLVVDRMEQQTQGGLRLRAALG